MNLRLRYEFKANFNVYARNFMGLPVIYSMNLLLRYDFKAYFNVCARDFVGLPAKSLIDKVLFLIIRNR